jgi:hypothetical protein
MRSDLCPTAVLRFVFALQSLGAGKDSVTLWAAGASLVVGVFLLLAGGVYTAAQAQIQARSDAVAAAARSVGRQEY